MAVIFMAVMLAFGTAISSIAYKQAILTSAATQSQVAFYAADAALECAHFYHTKPSGSLFAFKDPGATVPSDFYCDGEAPISSETVSHTLTPPLWVTTYRFSLDSNAHCADVTVYKYKGPTGPLNKATYVFSQGYNVACDKLTDASSRFVSRGLQFSN